MARKAKPKAKKTAAQNILDLDELLRLPKLDNATPSSLVDLLGDIREVKKAAEKLEGIYKEALKGRLEPNETAVAGERHSALVETVTQERFDQKSAEAEMGVDWIQSHKKTIEFVQIRTTRNTGE